MRAWFTDTFPLPLPPGHRLPIGKYRALRERLTGDPRFALLVPPPASDAQLLRAHTPRYLQRVVNGQLDAAELRALGLPWSPALVERSRRSCGATLCAARAALEDGVAASLAGGSHHARADRGAGYCVFNDVAVAALDLRRTDRNCRVLVVDADVHQGDGTAELLAGRAGLYTYSIHGATNYPYRKSPSDLDVALPDGTGDGEYLEAFRDGLETALKQARPTLVFYLAGADPHERDRLGRLDVTGPGLAARDRLLFERCITAAGLPVAVVMAGGYAEPIEATVDAHYQTLCLAAQHSRHTSDQS